MVDAADVILEVCIYMLTFEENNYDDDEHIFAKSYSIPAFL